MAGPRYYVLHSLTGLRQTKIEAPGLPSILSNYLAASQTKEPICRELQEFGSLLDHVRHMCGCEVHLGSTWKIIQEGEKNSLWEEWDKIQNHDYEHCWASTYDWDLQNICKWIQVDNNQTWSSLMGPVWELMKSDADRFRQRWSRIATRIKEVSSDRPRS
jgi:hypothetical protein